MSQRDQHNDPLTAHTTSAAPVEDIVSVNSKKSTDNKIGKSIFILIVGAVLVSIVVYFGQFKLNELKHSAKQTSAPKTEEDKANFFNPEKTNQPENIPKLGAQASLVPPSVAQAKDTQPAPVQDDTLRPIRGADGNVMVNAQGRALAVDKGGRVVEVPPIQLAGQEGSRPALPGGGNGTSGQAPSGQASSQPGATNTQPPPSRYGGSLFVVSPSSVASGQGSPASTNLSPAEAQARQVADIIKQINQVANPPAPAQPASNVPFFPPGVPQPPEGGSRPGTVAGSLNASATPVAYAARMPDQNFLLPKGRQADCILTGRIIDEVPGFTSCVLAQDLFSDNGKVLLLERGSELTGEYGVTNQLGSERLFVTWTRVKTPNGIYVDLMSPGADRLGTSGVPGHLDNRWMARIGTAFLLSFVKDVTVAIINNQNKSSSGSATVSVSSPGQNTVSASSALAEEVIKQTLKVRPRLTINEGDRISVYVARDLDFSRVYELRHSGQSGSAKVLAK